MMAVPTKNSEHKPLGSVWVICPYPPLSLGLGKLLEVEARVYSGKELPKEDPPSFIIFCPNEEDIVAEVKRLQALVPDAHVLVFGLRNDLHLAWMALQAGARGFIHAKMEPAQIIRALSEISKGERVISKGLLKFLLAREEPRVDLGVLTSRQREILELVAKGLTNSQIAGRLFLSESTIKQHLRAAYKLLGVRNRTEAARLVRDHT